MTELLRHFYAILNRSGEQAPKNGNAAALKAEAVVRRLRDVNGEALEKKKRKITEMMQHGSDTGQ